MEEYVKIVMLTLDKGSFILCLCFKKVILVREVIFYFLIVNSIYFLYKCSLKLFILKFKKLI